MGASYPTKVLLAFRNGDRCALPGCCRQLTVDDPNGQAPVVTGEAAHIAGEKPDAARYVSTMTDDERNHYNNLIYLCGDCHTRIDKQEDAFPIPMLQQIKADHEKRAREAMNAAFADIGFPELRMATEWMSKVSPSQSAVDFTLVAPDAKIHRNGLSSASRLTIAMGISASPTVAAFVEQESLTDSDFPERLKAGFLEEYYRLRKEGFRGDELFEFMCEFAQRGMREQSKRTAGLAVLIYLFERCEVFEK